MNGFFGEKKQKGRSPLEREVISPSKTSHGNLRSELHGLADLSGIVLDLLGLVAQLTNRRGFHGVGKRKEMS